MCSNFSNCCFNPCQPLPPPRTSGIIPYNAGDAFDLAALTTSQVTLTFGNNFPGVEPLNAFRNPKTLNYSNLYGFVNVAFATPPSVAGTVDTTLTLYVANCTQGANVTLTPVATILSATGSIAVPVGTTNVVLCIQNPTDKVLIAGGNLVLLVLEVTNNTGSSALVSAGAGVLYQEPF